MKKYIKIYGSVLIVVLVVISLVCVLTYKEPLNQATIDEIRALNGFGDVLSERVVNYIDENPDADIEDLIVLYGIGDKRVKILKKEFK